MTSYAGRKSRPTGGRDVGCAEGIALDPLADEGAHHSHQLIGRICGVRRDGGPLSPDPGDANSPARLRALGHGPGPRPVHDPGQRAPRRHDAVRFPGDGAAVAWRGHRADRAAGPVGAVRVLAEIDVLGLDLLEVRQLEQDREPPEPGDGRSQ